MASPNFPQGGSLYQQRQGKVIDDPNSEANQKKLLSATRRAKDSEAKAVARQVAAKNNPVNQPGSGILSLPYDISKPLGRPSNLPVRDTSKMFEITPYGPPRRGDGRQTITTYKPASTARNPYAGLPVAPTKEDLKDKKSYSAFLNKNAAAIDERMAAYQKWEQENKSQYTTQTEDDLDRFNANQDKQQAIRDRVRGKQEAEEEKNNAVKRDLAEAKRTGEPVSVQDGKYDVGDKRATLQIRKPPEPYKVPQWQKDITKKYKSIGEKDSRENKAYVDEYKRQTASGIAFDPMELADEVMKGLNPAPPTRPATPSPTPAPAPATPAPAPAPANPAPAPGRPYTGTDRRYPYATPETSERLEFNDDQVEIYPYQTPELNGVPYSPSSSLPAPIIPTNPLPDGVTPAEDAPISFDPNRPRYGGKTNTLPPGALNPNPLNRPDFNPTPVNPYAPVYNELNGNVNPGQYSPYRPVDPSNTIDLNAAENFNLQSYDTNLTGKRDATPSLPQQNSRGRFAPNGAVEPDLPVASTDGSNNDSNLMPPEMDVYTPVEKKKKKTI